jgi:hypothetical protein
VKYADNSIAKFHADAKNLTPSIRNNDFKHWLVEGTGSEWERMGF